MRDGLSERPKTPESMTPKRLQYLYTRSLDLIQTIERKQPQKRELFESWMQDFGPFLENPEDIGFFGERLPGGMDQYELTLLAGSEILDNFTSHRLLGRKLRQQVEAYQLNTSTDIPWTEVLPSPARLALTIIDNLETQTFGFLSEALYPVDCQVPGRSGNPLGDEVIRLHTNQIHRHLGFNSGQHYILQPIDYEDWVFVLMGFPQHPEYKTQKSMKVSEAKFKISGQTPPVLSVST